MDNFFIIFKDPSQEIFWIALGTITTLSVALASLMFFCLKQLNQKIVWSKTEILIQAQTEIFKNWVKTISKTEEIDFNNIETWLSNGAIINFGRDYKIYKLFVQRLNKSEKLKVPFINKDKFTSIIKDYDNAPKWGRKEW